MRGGPARLEQEEASDGYRRPIKECDLISERTPPDFILSGLALPLYRFCDKDYIYTVANSVSGELSMETSPVVFDTLPFELSAKSAHSAKSIESSVDRAQQKSWTNIGCPIEIETWDELCMSCNWLTMSVLAKPKRMGPEENAIAVRILELRDRLGGFIKPSLRSPLDKST